MDLLKKMSQVFLLNSQSAEKLNSTEIWMLFHGFGKKFSPEFIDLIKENPRWEEIIHSLACAHTFDGVCSGKCDLEYFEANLKIFRYIYLLVGDFYQVEVEGITMREQKARFDTKLF